MSKKEVGELKREVEAALQNFPESDRLRLLAIEVVGMFAPNCSQAASIARKFSLGRKGQELARKIRKILTEDPAGDFLQVLKDFLETKESEMDKKLLSFSDRVEKLKGKIGSKIDTDGEFIKRFIERVIEEFESELGDLEFFFKLVKEFSADSLVDDSTLDEVVTKLKEIGFTVLGVGRTPRRYIKVALYREKSKTNPSQTKSQVVVKEDPKKINDVRARGNFVKQIRSIVEKYGWHLGYADTLIVIDWGAKMGDTGLFGYLYMHFELVPGEVIFWFIHRDEPGKTSEPLPSEERGLPEKRWELLPKIEKFTREVAETTGLQVVIHK